MGVSAPYQAALLSGDAAAILGAIVDLDGPYDLQIQEQLWRFLIPMNAAANQQGENCAPVIELLRRGAGTRNILKRILICSALGDITGEPEWFDALFDDAGAPEVSFEPRHTLFVLIGMSLFRNRGKIAEADYVRLEQVRLRALFMQLVGEMEAVLAGSSFAAASPSPVAGRVVILTPQFLAPPHATTLRALEYASSLIHDFGKTPVIVESHPFPADSPIAFVPPLLSNRNGNLRAMDVVEVNGRPVEYYKVASDFFTISDLVHTTALVSALSPELVIAINCPYLAAEAAALRFPTFCQPTTASSPITRRAKTFSWNPPTPEQQALMQRLGVEDPSLFHMPPGFSAPEEHPPVSRAELGLPADAFVFAVVGVRLDDDVDGRFLDLLETITADPRAHVAMMGRFDEFEAALAPRPALAGRVSFLGYRQDILSVLRVCDAYINPDRTGGGRSGAYALHAGLPVLSLRRGDVAGAVGPERCCASYEEMAVEAARLIADPDRLAVRREEALARAGELIGVRGLIARIFAEMNIPA
jgi:glycosyltransferase involved in cell wall biosynthesis